MRDHTKLIEARIFLKSGIRKYYEESQDLTGIENYVSYQLVCQP